MCYTATNAFNVPPKGTEGQPKLAIYEKIFQDSTYMAITRCHWLDGDRFADDVAGFASDYCG